MICLSRILLRPGILFAFTKVTFQDLAPFAGYVASVHALREAEVLIEKGWENSNGYNSNRNFHFVYLEYFNDREEPGLSGKALLVMIKLVSIELETCGAADRNETNQY
jgi:hypothetical protein